MKKSRKTTLTLLCAALIAASAAGCAQKQAENTANKYPAGEVTYPIKTEGEKVTFWVGLNSAVSKFVTTATDTQYAQEANKRTGINVEFVHPPAGQEETKFNLLLASGSMPDIIAWDWMNLSDDIDDLIDKGYITKLNGAMEGYIPNMTKYIKTIDGLDKLLQTDGGNYYVFPFIRGDKKLYTSAGLVIRRDWLEKLNLPIPETTDEMETTLRAFKNELGIKAPLTMLKSNVRYLLGMCSSTNTFYVDNGTIKFGPAESEYKDAVIRLNKWFNEGLLDKNYVSTDSTLLDSNMLNGVSGVTYASGGSGVGKWLDTMSSKGESFDIVGIPFLSLKKGESPKFDASDSAYAPYGSTAITSSCKNPELAAKYLDYSYSDEGYMLYNFGIEGVSYTMVDNQPVYTDEIMHNSEGLTVSQAMGKYFVAANEGPFIQDKRCIEQYYARPQQQESLSNWSKFIDTSSLTKLPVLTYTAEESAEYANIMADVTKLVDENTAQLISGTMPLSSYDSYLNSLAELKIERATEIVQTAYNRYLNRK